MALQLDITSSQLLKAIDKLETSELEEVAEAVSLLRAQRSAPSLSEAESDLLLLISSSSLDQNERDRLAELGKKLEAEQLSNTERVELQLLTEQSENLTVKRMEYVSKLAQLKGRSLFDTMFQLGLLNPDVPTTK